MKSTKKNSQAHSQSCLQYWGDIKHKFFGIDFSFTVFGVEGGDISDSTSIQIHFYGAGKELHDYSLPVQSPCATCSRNGDGTDINRQINSKFSLKVVGTIKYLFFFFFLFDSINPSNNNVFMDR